MDPKWAAINANSERAITRSRPAPCVYRHMTPFAPFSVAACEARVQLASDYQ